MSALVSATAGSDRVTEVMVGASVSTGTVSGPAAALPLPAASRTAFAAMLTVTLPVYPEVGVTVAVHTSASDVAARVAEPLVTVQVAHDERTPRRWSRGRWPR